MNLDHLVPQAQALATAPLQTRIREFWPRIFVDTDAATTVFKELDRLFLRADQARSPILLVWGESNVGKTAILERYVKEKMEEATAGGELHESHYPKIPAVMISMPTDNNRTEFFELILTRLGRPFNPYGRNEALSVMTRRLMEETGVRLAIFDEIHNVIPLSSNTKDEMLRQIKELSNKLRRPLVLSGTADAHDFVSRSTELRERFYSIEVGRLKRGKEFSDFLGTIEFLIPLQKRSNLTSERMAELLYVMSGGLTGTLSELLFHASVSAVEDGTERITRTNLISTIYARNIIARLGVKRSIASAAHE